MKILEFIGAMLIIIGTFMVSYGVMSGWVVRGLGDAVLIFWCLNRKEKYWWLAVLSITGVCADINGIRLGLL